MRGKKRLKTFSLGITTYAAGSQQKEDNRLSHDPTVRVPFMEHGLKSHAEIHCRLGHTACLVY